MHSAPSTPEAKSTRCTMSWIPECSMPSYRPRPARSRRNLILKPRRRFNTLALRPRANTLFWPSDRCEAHVYVYVSRPFISSNFASA
eukprot:3787020-Rhodomonas_salina.1